MTQLSTLFPSTQSLVTAHEAKSNVHTALTVLTPVAGTGTMDFSSDDCRWTMNAAGAIIDLATSNDFRGCLGDIEIIDGDAVTWPVAWIWQTTEPVSLQSNGIDKFHFEGVLNEVGDGFVIWAWHIGTEDWT